MKVVTTRLCNKMEDGFLTNNLICILKGKLVRTSI
jgi:hypothetical protein